MILFIGFWFTQKERSIAQHPSPQTICRIAGFSAGLKLKTDELALVVVEGIYQ